MVKFRQGLWDKAIDLSVSLKKKQRLLETSLNFICLLIHTKIFLDIVSLDLEIIAKKTSFSLHDSAEHPAPTWNWTVWSFAPGARSETWFVEDFWKGARA